MGRLVLKSGDVFQSDLSKNRRGYFQFLYKDDSYLAGHLIRGFSFTGKIYESLEEIVSSPIAFFGFTRVFEGLKEGYWIRLGNVPVEKTFEPPMFRCTGDTRFYVEKSYDWYIWKGDFDDAVKIGELTDEYKDLPYSTIIPPGDVIEWLEAGRQVIDYLPD